MINSRACADVTCPTIMSASVRSVGETLNGSIVHDQSLIPCYFLLYQVFSLSSLVVYSGLVLIINWHRYVPEPQIKILGITDNYNFFLFLLKSCTYLYYQNGNNNNIKNDFLRD